MQKSDVPKLKQHRDKHMGWHWSAGEIPITSSFARSKLAIVG